MAKRIQASEAKPWMTVFTMTKPEREALYAVWKRDMPHANLVTSWRHYRRFRKQAQYHSTMGCWMVPWKGMWLGIEKDGYTHS